MGSRILLLAFLLAAVAGAQTGTTSETELLKRLLQRMDDLEQQNRQLTKEVHALRQEITASHSPQTATEQPPPAPAGPTLDERVSVNENRINEQSQTKVESSQKFPISLHGMFLFNSFLNTGAADADSPGSYPNGLIGPNSAGATLRQSIIGLRFQGPSLPGGGRVWGDLMMDFYSGPPSPGNNWLRIRRGTLSFDWTNRAFTVGQDKPLISPREPNSLAEVGVPPLAGAGNLWLWLPQARYEERFHFGQTNGLTAQVAVMQTDETSAYVPPELGYSLERSRPAIEGRLAFWHKWDDTKRFELAPGFHASTTHVADTHTDSRIASLDWLIVPWSKLEISGAFLHGRNFAGVGGLPQGFTILHDSAVIPVHSNAGWLQISSPITNRLTLNLFGGIQNNRASDLLPTDIARNISYAGNLMYHIGPNVIVSLEGLQVRTRLLDSRNQILNRYDLALAYLF